jgi:hypothetical protein
MPIVDIHVHTAYSNPTPDSFAQYIVDYTGRPLADFMAEYGDPRRYLALMDELAGRAADESADADLAIAA